MTADIRPSGQHPRSGATIAKLIGATHQPAPAGGSFTVQANGGGGGADGDDGWSPVLAVISDGERRVFRVVDWVGGTGSKPVTGRYVGASGLTADIAAAIDIRGPKGEDGGGGSGDGDDGWSPVLAVVSDGARRVLQITDWTGGTGSKPATGYVGATGLVSTIGEAVDIRGPTGAAGAKGDKGDKGDQGDPGPGVAAGGSAGQLLAKISAADYATEWIDPPSGGGGGDDTGWDLLAEEVVPEGGASSIIFDGLDPTYEVLLIEVSAQYSVGGGLNLTIGDAGNINGYRRIYRSDNAPLGANINATRSFPVKDIVTTPSLYSAIRIVKDSRGASVSGDTQYFTLSGIARRDAVVGIWDQAGGEIEHIQLSAAGLQGGSLARVYGLRAP